MDDFPRFTHSEYKIGNNEQGAKLQVAPAVEEEELEEEDLDSDVDETDESKVRTVEQSI